MDGEGADVGADEPSREPSNVRESQAARGQPLRELAATQGHVEGLQQVRVLGPGCGACSASCFHCTARSPGAQSLEEEWISSADISIP